jgi:hypothetical protein
MAMQECVCTGCGAINQVSAESCWRCLDALLDDRPAYPAPASPTEPTPQRVTA